MPNLNPSQAKIVRPQSASLRTPRGDPSFNRMRNDGQATPRMKPPEAPPAAGEEEPWLFAFERCLTTMDVWKMGFSRVMVFGAHHWADEATAAAEMSEAFRATTAIGNLSAQHKADLESIIAPCFLRGDVLLAVQCTQCSILTKEDKAACMRNVAKMLDCMRARSPTTALLQLLLLSAAAACCCLLLLAAACCCLLLLLAACLLLLAACLLLLAAAACCVLAIACCYCRRCYCYCH